MVHYQNQEPKTLEFREGAGVRSIRSIHISLKREIRQHEEYKGWYNMLNPDGETTHSYLGT